MIFGYIWASERRSKLPDGTIDFKACHLFYISQVEHVNMFIVHSSVVFLCVCVCVFDGNILADCLL